MSRNTRLHPRHPKSAPRPLRILSKQKLLEAWYGSRDSGSKPGAPGSDGVRAKSFAANLDENLTILARQLRDGSFRFSRLRARPIERPGKTDRVICIPTVKDRLVQRSIVSYIYARQILPIKNSSSFGFLPETGTKDALRRCIELRARHDYVFETDITSFFDTIDRSILVEKLQKRLRGSSLLEIVKEAVRLEIARTSPVDEKRISQAGIKKGEGLRQGMPLSPVLANFVLSEFDATIEKHGYLMVRYADDLVVFADSLAQAKAAQDLILNELTKINHHIPDISEAGKTRIVGRQQEFDFLGRTIVFSESAGRYVQKISGAKIKAITSRLRADSDLNKLIKMQIDFPTFTAKLSRTVASYIKSYSDAYNAAQFESEMRQVYRSILNTILSEIFGEEAVKSADSKHIKFLGLSPRIDEHDDLEIVE